MKKQLTSAALAVLLAGSALPVTACAAKAAAVPSLNRTEHVQYMNGYADGTFRPDASVTRAEVCKLLASLLTDRVKDVDYLFSDVEVSAWYADAVRQMAGFGLIGGYKDGTFRPDAAITRAELAAILARLPHTDIAADKTFSDVPESHWARQAVQTAAAQGWVGGYPDGTFRPDAAVTRAETVTMINRVLGRQGDRIMASTGSGIRIMPDVPDTHWAYPAMLEATMDHKFELRDGTERWTSFDKETTALEQGWHNIGGELFHVNADFRFDSRTEVDGLTLDRNGRYTTGDEALDRLLTDAVRSAVTDGMAQQDRLRAVYDYAKRTFGYRGVGTADTAKPDWEIERAKDMLETGKGNCYSWSAAFTHLARKVGYDAKAVVGKGVSPKGSESVHAWTEITIDGQTYTFDPQIESVYASRYGEQYDLYMKKQGEAAWGYIADEAQQPETPQEPEADAALVSMMEKIYNDKEMQQAMRQIVLYKGMGADGQSYKLSGFLGVDDLDIEAGLASEPMINVHPHSIVLARFKEGADMEAAKKAVAENADPFKWICVGVDPKNVRVETAGRLLLLVMDDEQPDTYVENFRKLTQTK